jgi:hypothetical protein
MLNLALGDVERCSFAAGQVIFKDGDDAHREVCVIHAGTVEIRRRLADTDRVLRTIGDLPLFRHAPRSTDTVAREYSGIVSGATRTWLLAVFLLPLSLFAGSITLSGRPPADDVELREARFGPLRSRIPAGAMVGLLTNLPHGGHDRTRERYLAQYVLAPAIVATDEHNPPFVIVDVWMDRPPLSSTALAGLEPIVDLGNGVALYRRVAR